MGRRGGEERREGREEGGGRREGRGKEGGRGKGGGGEGEGERKSGVGKANCLAQVIDCIQTLYSGSSIVTAIYITDEAGPVS